MIEGSIEVDETCEVNSGHVGNDLLPSSVSSLCQTHKKKKKEPPQ